MKNIRKYKAPKAEITVFECAEDIMTASRTLYKKPGNVGERDYVKAGTISWSDNIGKNE